MLVEFEAVHTGDTSSLVIPSCRLARTMPGPPPRRYALAAMARLEADARAIKQTVRRTDFALLSERERTLLERAKEHLRDVLALIPRCPAPTRVVRRVRNPDSRRVRAQPGIVASRCASRSNPLPSIGYARPSDPPS